MERAATLPGATVTDGGVHGRHDGIVRLPIYVAPSAKPKKDALNTVRGSIFAVACSRIEDSRFAFDSSLVHPSAAHDLQALASTRAPGDPSTRLSVFGHADPVGNDDYNKTLSGRRARAVHALLTRRADVWEDLYSNPFGGDRWGLAGLQIMLGAVGFDPGAPDGHDRPKTQDAFRRFQASRAIAETGHGDHATRHELFLAYMDAVCGGASSPIVYDASEFFGGGADPDGKADFQGCGELNPILLFAKDVDQKLQRAENHARRDALNRPNRRVIVFVFPADLGVTIDDWPCPRAKEPGDGCKAQAWSDGDTRRAPSDRQREAWRGGRTFACRFYDSIARGSPCESLRRDVDVTLLDGAHKRMPGAPFRLTAGSQSRSGNADDRARILVPGILVPGEITLEWGDPRGEDERDGSPPDAFAFQATLDLRLDDAAKDDDTQAKRRLHNLGYRGAFADQVAEFQDDYGVARAAWPDAATRDRLFEVSDDGLEAEPADPGAGPDPFIEPDAILLATQDEVD